MEEVNAVSEGRWRRIATAGVVVGLLAAAGVAVVVGTRVPPGVRAARAREAAVSLSKQGRRGEAVELLRAAIEENPREAETRALHGELLVEDGDVAAGVREFEAAVAIDPRHLRGNMGLARQEVGRGDAAGALRRLDALVAAGRREPALHYLRAETRLAAGALGGAVEDFEVAREGGVLDARACLRAGYAAALAAELTWSVDLAQRGAAFFHAAEATSGALLDPDATAVLAAARLALGRHGAALTALDAGRPGDEGPLLRAEALALRGDAAGAAALLRTAVAANPDSAAVAALLRLLARERRLEEAQEELALARARRGGGTDLGLAAAEVRDEVEAARRSGDFLVAALRWRRAARNPLRAPLAHAVLTAAGDDVVARRARLSMCGSAVLIATAQARERDADAPDASSHDADGPSRDAAETSREASGRSRDATESPRDAAGASRDAAESPRDAAGPSRRPAESSRDEAESPRDAVALSHDADSFVRDDAGPALRGAAETLRAAAAAAGPGAPVGAAAHAEDDIAWLLARDPADAFGLTWKGALALRRGDRAVAREALVRAVEVAPESTEARVALAAFYLDTGEPQWAAAQLAAARRADRTEIEAALAVAQHRAGRTREAAETLGRALVKWPDDVSVAAALEETLGPAPEFAGRLPGMAVPAPVAGPTGSAAGAPRADPPTHGLPSRNVVRARVALARGDLASAAQAAAFAVAEAPADGDARALSAEVWRRAAVLHAVRAAAEPDDAFARVLQAECLVRAGERAQAVQVLREQEARDSDPRVRVALARALAGGNDLAGAEAVMTARPAGALTEEERFELACLRVRRDEPRGLDELRALVRADVGARVWVAAARKLLEFGGGARRLAGTDAAAEQAGGAQRAGPEGDAELVLAAATRRCERADTGVGPREAADTGVGPHEVADTRVGPHEAADTGVGPYEADVGADTGVGPYEVKALALAALGRVDEAIEVAETLRAAAPGDAETARVLARLLVDAGRAEDAETLLVGAIASSPAASSPGLASLRRSLAAVRVHLGLSALRAGDHDAASRWLVDALDGRQHDVLACQLLALSLPEPSEEAIDVLRRRVDALYPASPAGPLVAAYAHVRRGDHREALAWFREAEARDVTGPAGFAGAMRMLLALGETEAAEADCRMRIARGDPTGYGAFLLGMVLDARRDARGADEAFGCALAADPGNLEFLERRVDSLVRVGRAGEARRLVRDAPAHVGRSERSTIALARLTAEIGEPADAAARLEGLADSPRTDSVVLVETARLARAAGDVALARERFERAIAADPRNPVPQLELAQLLMSGGRADEAAAWFRARAQERPQDGTTWTVLGLLAASQVPPARAEAERCYRRALEESPRSLLAANNLAWLVGEELGRTSEALLLAEAAKGTHPGSPDVADTYGWLLHRSGRSAEALVEMDLAVRCRPRDVRFQFHRAQVLEGLGRLAAATQTYEEVLRLAPGHAGAREASIRLQRGGSR